MPLYHFNVHDGVSVPDPEGHELPGIEVVRREAVLFAAGVISEMGEKFWDDPEWRLEVTDDQGLILFTLMFVGNLTAAGSLVSLGG